MRTTHLKPLVLGTLLLSLIFFIELYAGSMVGTVAYIFTVTCFLWMLRNSRVLVLFGALSSLVIISAFLILLPGAGQNAPFIINRILSLALVWLLVYFTCRFRDLYQKQQIKTGQLQALFRNAREGILFADENGRILLANPFLEKMFDVEPGELVQKNIQDLMPEMFALPHGLHIRNFIENPQNSAIMQELWAKDKEGNEFPVELNLRHFYSKQKLTLIAFIQDATEKKKHQELTEAAFVGINNYNLELEEKVKQRTGELELANQELQKSQYLYQAMAHHFPDGIIGILDRNMKYLLVDGQELSPMDPDKTSYRGGGLPQDVHFIIAHQAENALRKVFLGETVSLDIEQEEKAYHLSSVPIPDCDGEISEILVVVRNITAQKKLEKDLIRMLEKEKELSLLKSGFVTLASHEFRSPLTTILSSAFLLEHYTGEQLERERKKHLNRIRSSVNGLTELLNDFLSLGKLEEGQVKAVYAGLDLQDFMEDLLQEINLLKKDDQKVRLHFQGAEKRVLTDKHLLKNILMNLTSNAIKYSYSSGCIDLRVTVKDSGIDFQISDQGMGIPPEEQKHIFKRFFRAKNAAAIQGTGLGLNIVKKYVQLLDGSLSFSSRENEGTTFRVRLPLILDVQPTLTKTITP